MLLLISCGFGVSGHPLCLSQLPQQLLLFCPLLFYSSESFFALSCAHLGLPGLSRCSLLRLTELASQRLRLIVCLPQARELGLELVNCALCLCGLTQELLDPVAVSSDLGA